MENYDIIIIGAGPGGLTAGIYAGRQGTKNLIIDRDLAGGIGREVPEMENYPGFDNISGLELIEKMKAQAVKNCELHEMEEVTEIIKTDEEYRFTVKTAKDSYKSKTLILATGSSHRQLDAKGEEEFKGKGVINGLLYIPVVIPEIVIGIALLTIFSNTGVPRGMLTLILSHVSFCVPYVIFNVRARLSGYDSSIGEASMDLGANRVVTFFEITLPVLAPGIAGGALLAFTLSIDDVIISYFVNGQTKTYPLKVMESIKSGVSPDVNALSTLILLGTIGLVILTQSGILSGKHNKV